ncbi:MAG: hypothetical protein M1819_007200 [Sarea resinae]|nr:MAG: hypothetical protein M1819_007200 [Sarea resinae]
MPRPTSPRKQIQNKNDLTDGPAGSKAGTPLKNGNAPDLTLPSSPAGASFDYTELQQNEIEALQSIYMDDYEEVKGKGGAWSKSADRSFKLRLKSPSDPDTHVTLTVSMTATYPKTTPLLAISDAEGLRAKTRKKVQEIVRSKPKTLLGSEMIFEITASIEDILEDAVQSRATEQDLPSLEEERAIQEAAATQLARKQEEELRKKRQEESLEEERVLSRMLEEEMKRHKEKAREAKRKGRQPSPDIEEPSDMHKDDNGRLSFDQTIHIKDENGDILPFRTVAGKVQLCKGPTTDVYTVRPLVAESSATVPALVLKHAKLKSKPSEASDLKKRVQSFENDLEALKKLRHPNIIDLLDFKVSLSFNGVGQDGGVWDISLLTEFANKGTLGDLLDIVGFVRVEKVRAFSIQLLEALEFFHVNGVVHRDIHASNIMISKSRSDTPVIKLADGGYQQRLRELKGNAFVDHSLTTAQSAFWLPPELAQDGSTQRTRKTDIWDLGVVFLQMIFGLNVLQQYSSPTVLVDSMDLSESLEEIIRKFFKPDPKKRPTAFDLLPSEFLRNDAPVLAQPSSPTYSRLSSTVSLSTPRHLRPRHESLEMGGSLSRYANDFVEAGRLGKGGYGEVVKARNKLDGQIYAIKKITQNSASSLTDVLSEVMYLSRLNHPYVVRYITAWIERDFMSFAEADEEAVSSTMDRSISPNSGPNIEFGHSTGGLDFISSSGYPKIEFEYDSQNGSSDWESEDGARSTPEHDEKRSDSHGNSLRLKRTRSDSRSSRPVKTTLYIQMEYCEKHTLRDLIRQGIYNRPEECWQLLRQVLEGLSHIHGHGIIHRDLKPDNVFIDAANNPRIGDFGLATSGQYYLADKASSSNIDGDMTRSIGTTLYVAPELSSSSGEQYTDKVDMYSLGIIFFEMCYPLKTAMERDAVIRGLREREHVLPAEFQTMEKAVQGEIINSLISHRPKERPSSIELLQCGKIPLQVEDETIRQAFQGLADPNSQYYQKMMSALFSQPLKQVKDYAWDMSSQTSYEAEDLLLQSTVKAELATVFRRHGAVETQRSLLLPRSSYYSTNIVRLLDSSGTLLQLPHDLTLPHARAIAKQVPSFGKSFAFGNVYRDLGIGGQPRSHGEVDFDIVSFDTLDLALKEAEVLKVIDEVIDAFPSLATTQMCFHINHSDLLNLILEFCRISVPQRPAVKEILSKLHVGKWTWQSIRNELRSPSLGVSSTSLDDLARFDFRDVPEKAFTKLKRLFEGTDYIDSTASVFAHINTVTSYMTQFNIRRKIYVSPLSSFNDQFYKGGVLFQCVYDTKRRDVFAAGGRYDSLIQEHKPKLQRRSDDCHAVGFNLGWEKLYTSMARYQKRGGKSFLKKAEDEPQGQWATKRCDVLVGSFDSAALRTIGIKIVQELWANDISAELATDAHHPEELLSRYRDDKHSWLIIIRQETGSFGERSLKVRNMVRKEDTDVRSSELMSWLRAEMRDRDQREGTHERAKLLRRSSHQNPVSSGDGEREADVRVLLSNHKSKKSNRRNIVEAAQTRTQELAGSFLDGPIAAIDTRDEVLDAIRDTRLSDPDSWRGVIQSVPLAERKYLSQVHELLGDMAKDSRGTTRNAFIYNFRTGGCIYYDLGRGS